MSDELAQAANTALETYQELAQHAARCQQCRTDPSFCDTRKQYVASFESDVRKWQRIHDHDGSITVARGARSYPVRPY